MSNLENNKMIAEWMGYDIVRIKNETWMGRQDKSHMHGDDFHIHMKRYQSYEIPEKKWGCKNSDRFGFYGQKLSDFRPDLDWNQSMIVVGEIEKDEEIYISISRKACAISQITPQWYEKLIVSKAAETKIQAVYQAVTEYIKQQKENQTNG